VLAGKNVDEPPRARDVFRVLERLGVISGQQATGMEKLVDLRNLFVHDYAEFSADTTPDQARRALPLLKEVARELASALP
jgi:uncharacterized protein YutE (UPF0331/DUF86 family)